MSLLIFDHAHTELTKRKSICHSDSRRFLRAPWGCVFRYAAGRPENASAWRSPNFFGNLSCCWFLLHIAAFLTPRSQTSGIIAVDGNSPEGRFWMRLLAILLWLGVLPFACSLHSIRNGRMVPGEASITTLDGWAWGMRRGGEPGRRCKCRSLRGRRLFSGGW